MNDESKSPPQISSRQLGEATAPAEAAPSGIDRRRIIFTALKAAPIITTLGVTAGRAQADPKASAGASGNSSIKASKVNK